ncbi:MAG: ATP-binding protein [Patescibacteria group bacterium]|nr:ATP-binding protein [Patescibacteria group bacterium]
MIFYAIVALVNAITSTILGLFVYLKNRKSKINQAFGLFCLSASIWSYSYYFWQIADSASGALFWSRSLMMGAIFINIFYFHFVLRLFNKVQERKKSLIFGYLIFFFFFLANFTSLFVKGVRPKLGFDFWPDPGILYHPFLFFWFFYAIYVIYLLSKEYRLTIAGIKRNQIRYILIGTIVGYVGGITNYLLWYDIPIAPIGNWTATFYVPIIAYAILKYRLMDVRLAIKKSTIFSVVVVVITAVYAMAAFLLGLVFFGGIYTFKGQVVTGLLTASLVAFGFMPLYEWLKKTTDTFLFKGDYNSQELLANISDVLSRTLDLSKVVNILEEKIGRALRLKKVDVIILKDKDFLGRKKSPKIKNTLKKTIAYFEKQKDVLVLDELKRKRADKIEFTQSFHLIEDLEKLKAALVVPLKLKEKLVGLFILDAKKSGDMFTNEDIQVLETIASQAAVAIENAWLYGEMKGFSKTLQEEVERQTKELKDANIQLKQLDEAKSEFISLASHQLRTPLSIIKGYISMILEGTWGETNEKQKNCLEKVYLSNERLIKLVEDLLTVSRIESGRLDFDLQPLAIDSLTESIVGDSQSIAAQKGLYLKYIKPEKPLPKVKADSLKVRQVIQNLVDNAIHYTKEGGATVRLKKENKKIIFSIKDTGIGISSKEKSVLFEKFSRGEGMSKLNTEGTGLGLYLAAKLIKAHKGKIWIESEGKGKGSAFYFELPIG